VHGLDMLRLLTHLHAYSNVNPSVVMHKKLSSTAQHSTAQHSTAQHSTAHICEHLDMSSEERRQAVDMAAYHQHAKQIKGSKPSTLPKLATHVLSLMRDPWGCSGEWSHACKWYLLSTHVCIGRQKTTDLPDQLPACQLPAVCCTSVRDSRSPQSSSFFRSQSAPR
jgi:hypothetical protein